MLAKAYRMTGDEFLKIVGIKPTVFYVSYENITLFSVASYTHNENFSAKYAISLSKKVAKTSVLRHRIKRRIMSALENKVCNKKVFRVIRIHDKSVETLDFKILQEKLTSI